MATKMRKQPARSIPSGEKASRRSAHTLQRYIAKRDFRKTAEPRGTHRASGDSFCVQKHDATHLHYDFRLELDGVLLSWAVPKGPSLDPAVKRLAMEVEPHPVEYGSFEGTIPRGQYGGGTVLLWDRGTWEPVEDPRDGYKRGTLHFELNGEKLRGRWRLVRSRKGNQEKPQWLLIKSKDAYSRIAPFDVLAERPRSVATDRDLAEIAAADDARPPLGRSKPPKREEIAATRARGMAGWPPVGAVPTKMPRSISPQLATLVDSVPDQPGWVHELKLDGYRLLAFKDQHHVRLLSRNGKDWTRKLAHIREAVGQLSVSSALLDGELVAFDKTGRTDFQLLQSLMKADPSQLQYVCFDLPWCDGYDLKRCGLLDRKAQLKQGIAGVSNSALRFCDHLELQTDELLREACRLGAEGIVSKQIDAPYVESRSRSWLKIKCVKSQELVIGGYTKPQGSRSGFGALLVGYHEEGQLRYAGKVGAGFDRPLLTTLVRQMNALRRSHPAFVDPPRGALARGVTWIEPELVCQVRFTGSTEDNALRHPVFEGLRIDKPAREVTRESPKSTEYAVLESKRRLAGKSHRTAKSAARRKSMPLTLRGVAISHPDRTVFSEIPLTKGQLAEYYDLVADAMLPHVFERPLMSLRCPQGIAETCFHQKHWAHLPPGVDSMVIAEADGKRTYPIVRAPRDILALSQFNVIEFHTWGCRCDNLEEADRVIFDLDPGPGVRWAAVVQAARTLRGLLKSLELVSFVKTSGGKGLHVVCPLSGGATPDAVRDFAESVSKSLSEKYPDLYVANMRKSRRANRIYVDYLRNARGATCVSAYSVRARIGAPVSVPIHWEQLGRIDGGANWTVPTLLTNSKKLPDGAWSDYSKLTQILPLEPSRTTRGNSSRRPR